MADLVIVAMINLLTLSFKKNSCKHQWYTHVPQAIKIKIVVIRIYPCNNNWFSLESTFQPRSIKKSMDGQEKDFKIVNWYRNLTHLPSFIAFFSELLIKQVGEWAMTYKRTKMHFYLVSVVNTPITLTLCTNQGHDKVLPPPNKEFRHLILCILYVSSVVPHPSFLPDMLY